MPSRQGTRDRDGRAVKKCEGKERKGGARATLCCSISRFAVFGGNDDVHPSSFLRKFNILAIEFPSREERGTVFHLLSFAFYLEGKQLTSESFGIESKDEKLMRDSSLATAE